MTPCVKIEPLWWQWHPPVGVFIALLGLLGVLVPLFRTWERIGPREKAAWTFVMFALLGLELRTLYLDRDEHDREQAYAECQQLQEFSNIAQSLSTVFTTSQQQFTATMGTTKEVLDKTKEAADMATEGVANMTGGDSYVVVAPITIPVKQPNTFALFASIGKNCHNRTLEDVSVEVRRLPIPGEGTMGQFTDSLNSSGNPTGFKGTLMAHTSQPIGYITPDLLGETSYVVNVDSRSKQTVETLKMRPSANGNWEYSFTVGQDLMTGRPGRNTTLKTLEKTDPVWRRTVALFK